MSPHEPKEEPAQSGCELSRCPLCGEPNGCQLCGANAYKGPCWCTNAKMPDELLTRVPPDMRNRVCICHACVAAFWRERQAGEPQRARPGEFYWDETGLIVFNEAYHLRRGYCCGNGCRHCPYQDPG